MLINKAIFEIKPLQPNQVAEARRVIYAVAHNVFHDRETLEETIDYYSRVWPLKDLDEYQKSYVENGGTFLVTLHDGRIIGTGALRRLDVQVGEIKRMWLLPEYQGQGHGYRMMQRLLEVAREKGYARVRLETSPRYQPRAYAFYTRLGFTEIPHYGDDPDDAALELIVSSKK